MIPEWGKTPEESYKNTLHLNNRYEMDGRDQNGLRRKIDADAYAARFGM
ncbi:MAG: hypothetical protein PVH73_04860 [Candidatus Bathyarchaeota archaeon]|jgi:hypothetical protein